MRLAVRHGYLSPDTGAEVPSQCSICTGTAQAVSAVEQVRFQFPGGVSLGLYIYGRDGGLRRYVEPQPSPLYYAFPEDGLYRLSTPAWTEEQIRLADFYIDAESGAWAEEVRLQNGFTLAGDRAGVVLRQEGDDPLDVLRICPDAAPVEVRGEGIYQGGQPLLRSDGDCLGIRVLTAVEYAALETAGELRGDTLYFVG